LLLQHELVLHELLHELLLLLLLLLQRRISSAAALLPLPLMELLVVPALHL
jgi:hypothetical protein